MITQDLIETFKRDGFVIIRNLLDADEIAAARERFEPLFHGKFETGLYPDEWNWQEGRDPADRTRIAPLPASSSPPKWVSCARA